MADTFVMAKKAPKLPALKPDRVTIWPVDVEHFGVEVLYRGRGAYRRALEVDCKLAAAGMATAFGQEVDGAWGVSFGPLERPAMLAVLTDVVGAAPKPRKRKPAVTSVARPRRQQPARAR